MKGNEKEIRLFYLEHCPYCVNAKRALKELPVDEVCARLLPEEKPLKAEELKRAGTLLYVGDGINDTPVMAASDISASMGGLGSDAAIEASDFVLAGDNLSALPKAVKGAKKTRRIVTENIVFSIAIKVIVLILSAVGLLDMISFGMIIAILADVGVCVLAILKSMRALILPKNKRPKSVTSTVKN